MGTQLRKAKKYGLDLEQPIRIWESKQILVCIRLASK